MKVYKDNQHSLTLCPFFWQGKRYLMVSVGLFAAFDPEGGTSFLRTEQDFWKEAPDAFAALGQAPVMDMNLPKPAAEVLVAGFARTPGKKPVKALEVSFRVGNTGRRLAVFGDRHRLAGGGVTEPIPFTAMPLVWERAFGGPDFALNPLGRGLLAENAPGVLLPNIEDPGHLLLTSDDLPAPACPLPIGLANPVRRALSGTYDQHWLETRWPHYPDDCAPDFFHSAQPAQRLASGPFFRGDEEMEIMGMHHEYPHIRSRLPDVRIRAFVLASETFAPFAEHGKGEKPPLPYAKDLDGPGIFSEVALRLDTVWLLPDLMGAFVIHRGLLPVVDDEMDDILRVFVVSEKPADPPQTLPFYLEELKKRAHPAVEIDLAPFVEAQAKTAKLVKKSRDVPKTLDRIKQRILGQSPAMPPSLGDMLHDAQKTLGTARTTLDTAEKQVLAQREQFSHVMSFDLSMFSRLRATVDAQEQKIGTLLQQAEKQLATAEATTQKRLNSARTKAEKALTPDVDASPEEVAQKAALLGTFKEKMAKMDGFTVEGMLCEPPAIAPWHDRGFPLVIKARRALKRHDSLLARLAQWGLESGSITEAWLGYAPESLTDTPEHWGLPASPQNPAFTLPAGLYLPRFAGKVLSGLTVYPIEDAEKDPLRGLGEEAPLLVRVPGSDETSLSLPAAHPGGAVIVAPEDLSAVFAEQEAGDFCHIVSATSPAALAAIKDLPPLLPPSETAEIMPETASDITPLVILLPPLPLGKESFAAWQKEYPAAIPLHLPEGCPNVLALAEKGHRLRRLLLDILPPALANIHDFDFPLPPKDRPMEPFTLNMPLPTKEELQGRIFGMIEEIKAHFPDPEKVIAAKTIEAKARIRTIAKEQNLPPELMAHIEEALAKPPPPKSGPIQVASAVHKSMASIASAKAKLPDNLPPEMREKILAELAIGEQKAIALGEQLAPLEALRDAGMAKLAAFKKGELPQEIEEKFAAQGMDPNAMKALTREDVQAILAGNRNLEKRNLQGLDLSGLDFSGASLAHALCGKTNFADCTMNGVDFTFTLAAEADFSRATFHEARFKQTVLQKAVLRKADFATARLELTTLGECDCTEATFDQADINLCNFSKAILEKANFRQTCLSLTAFSECRAVQAQFGGVRAFKCLFQKIDLDKADFRDAVLNQCLFQAASAAGVSFRKAELRKLYTEADTDLSRADFSGADLREASLRNARLCAAEFHGASLANALIVMCDLTRARLDGLHAEGCRFIKCDLTEADLSGTTLFMGALRKCRLTGTDLGGASLHGANLQDITVNSQTNFEGANCKRTILDGKKEALHDAAHRNS